MPELGGRLTNLQDQDLVKCVEYFVAFKTDPTVFQNEYKSLVKTAHSIAFTMNFFTEKISDVPEWANPYLSQLRSDSIQILPSVILKTKRTIHLYERACIEDFLRYTYFFDHKIEQKLLQTYPKKYQSIESMLDWLKEYPELKHYQKSVSANCKELSSRYSELSRTVHGTRVTDHQIVESLQDIGHQKIEPKKEEKIMKAVFRALFFLLAIFQLKNYHQLTLDQRTLFCQHLSEKQIRILSGLNN